MTIWPSRKEKIRGLKQKIKGIGMTQSFSPIYWKKMIMFHFCIWVTRQLSMFKQTRWFLNIMWDICLCCYQNKTRLPDNKLKNFTPRFYTKTSQAIRNILKKENNYVVALRMKHEIINPTTFKVLGAVIYCITDKQVCLNYVFLQKSPKIFHLINALKMHLIMISLE